MKNKNTEYNILFIFFKSQLQLNLVFFLFSVLSKKKNKLF